MSDFDRVIIDQVDLENLVPGGTDTCISDLVRFSESRLGVVGVTHSPSVPLGTWRELELSGRPVRFLPIARIDRSRPKGRLAAPHSLVLALAILRHKKAVPSETLLQAHRIEIGALISWFFPNAFVQFIHNDSGGLIGRNSESIWRHLSWLYRRLERRSVSRARSVVLFNKSDSERLRTLAPELIVASTWFDPGTFSPASQVGSTPLTVSLVGRLERQKDPLLAVEVMAAVSKRDASATFHIVGDGALREAVERSIELHGLGGRVSMHGAVPRSRVAELMSRSSVLLMTSHFEGSPRVLYEACASGLPIVATVGADPDQVLDGKATGVRVDTRDPIELANAILTASTFDRRACSEAVADKAATAAVPRLLSVTGERNAG